MIITAFLGRNPQLAVKNLSVLRNVGSRLILRRVGFALGIPVYCANMTDGGNSDAWKEAKSVYEFSAKDIDGNEVSLEKYRGHPLIIVNVACKCGFTNNNYKQLQELYEKYKDTKGLRILAFPSNQFANQEPGTEEEIKEFIKQFDVQFDMFSKISVNGKEAHPLWKYLKAKQGGILGDFIKWNFTKFVVDKEGQPVARYAPNDEPKKMEKDLEKYMA